MMSVRKRGEVAKWLRTGSSRAQQISPGQENGFHRQFEAFETTSGSELVIVVGLYPAWVLISWVILGEIQAIVEFRRFGESFANIGSKAEATPCRLF
jgi:hypothetical protein